MKRFEITATLIVEAMSPDDAERRFMEALEEPAQTLDANGIGFFIQAVEQVEQVEKNQFIVSQLDDF